MIKVKVRQQDESSYFEVTKGRGYSCLLAALACAHSTNAQNISMIHSNNKYFSTINNYKYYISPCWRWPLGADPFPPVPPLDSRHCCSSAGNSSSLPTDGSCRVRRTDSAWTVRTCTCSWTAERNNRHMWCAPTSSAIWPTRDPSRRTAVEEVKYQ